MGLNIAGILTDSRLDKKDELEKIFETKLKYTENVDGDNATLTKDSAEFDVHTSEKGSIVLFEMGEIYDFSNTKGEFIQFMISDVSDTYYFEKYKDGKLERKLIVSEGEVQEDKGIGIISKDDDFMDKVLEISSELMGIDDIFDINFKRFKPAKKGDENASKIGSEGKSVNFSSATRAMNTKPDKDQIKKYDELASKTNKIKYTAMLIAILAITLTIYLFQTGHWIFGSILVLVDLFIGFMAISINNSAAYESGLIVPAIIIETNPIKIIALADMRSSEEQEKLLWGCKKITLKNLPNHKIETGERIPCVSMFSASTNGYHVNFEPRPISWGFKDPKYIPEAIDVITNSEEENEWKILEKITAIMRDIDKENEVVFFDKNLNQTTIKEQD